MRTSYFPSRLHSILAILFVLSAVLMIGISGTLARPGTQQKTSAISYHDAWRQLWEDHIIWTRMVIIGILDGGVGTPLPGTNEATARLLKNYDDMEDALKPYYGDTAEELGDLIEEHLTIAVEILTAAKAGDTTAFNAAIAEWYANADEIATLMNEMNSQFWPYDMSKQMWEDHLDATLEEATARLTADYAADVTAFDKVHALALQMADFFSLGIVKQFPAKFTANGSLISSSKR